MLLANIEGKYREAADYCAPATPEKGHWRQIQ